MVNFMFGLNRFVSRFVWSRRPHTSLVRAVLVVLIIQAATSSTQAAENDDVEVIVVTPLMGSRSSAAKVPSNVQTIRAGDLTSRTATDLSDALFKNLGSVTLSSTQGNPFQEDLSFRGFSASPLLGTAIGLSVYMDGVRLNEGFGDTVNWDLVPEHALVGADLMPGSNPVFGLNTLGGAIVLRTKTGFTFDGAEVEVSDGNFDRRQVLLEYGGYEGDFGWYLSGKGLNDDGSRDRSPSQLRQMFGTLSWLDGPNDIHLSYGFNDNTLTGNGLAPESLLAVDREAVHTFPDISENKSHLLAARGRLLLSNNLFVNGNLYFRNFRRDTINGDAEIQCVDDLDTGIPIHIGLCEGTAAPFGGVGDLGRVAEAEDRTTRTETDVFGGTVEINNTGSLAGRINNFSFGVAYDQSSNLFRQGEAEADLVEVGLSHGTQWVGPNTNAVRVRTRQRALGIYFIDSLDLSEHVTLTVSGRYNVVNSKIRDRTGAPENQDLNGSHNFDRFSPAVGIAASPVDWATFFGGYSESFRVPTPAELTCADPEDPCNLPNAFVADPPLDPVVGKTWEVGLRGRASGLATVSWSLAAYRTTLMDDILFTATETGGAGYFINVEKTRRQGLEFSLRGRTGPVGWHVGYGFVDATFRSPETLASVVEPNGVQVRPGDRLPGIPRHNLKAGIDWRIVPRWTVGLGTVFASSQHLRGDEGNDHARLGSYAILNGSTKLRLSGNVEIWGRVDNILDRDHETGGVRNFNAFATPEIEEQRFLAPGRPRGAWVGVRIRLGKK